jgi:pSer/pThr/pTyr-binding forkhead associated (FHA) protein
VDPGEVMARLILMFNKQVVKEVPFLTGSMTIGRHEDNGIVIDNLAVSTFHARIDKTAADYILTDLQSTNGTYVNDERIASRRLSSGDNILIGKHVLLFAASDQDKPKGDMSQTLNKTMILDTLKQRQLLARQKTLTAPLRVPKKIGVVSFIDKSGLGEIELTKKLIKLGKAETSEIKLSGFLMGTTAATISRRPSGYVITFTGGLTKLKVNGKTVKDSVQLNEFDTVDLGSYRFQFYQKELPPA